MTGYDPKARRERIGRRIARETLAEVLSELGVVQDGSTADGLIAKAVHVEHKPRSKWGEVVLIALPLDTEPRAGEAEQVGEV